MRTALFMCFAFFASSTFAAEKFEPLASIVYIEAKRAPNSDHDAIEVSRGTGFIVKEGYVLTAGHVVFEDSADFTESHVVAFGSRFNHSYPVSVIKIDRDLDLALLSLPENIDVSMTPLTRGDSNAVSNGDKITAYGFPGRLDLSISEGILSSKRVPPKSYWQTTMGINRGQSGGPVLNSQGEWVAVAVAGNDDMSKVTYAIPANFANGLMSLVANQPRTSPSALPIRTVDFQFASLGRGTDSLASSTQRTCLPVGYKVTAAVSKSGDDQATVKPVAGASNCVDITPSNRMGRYGVTNFEIIGGRDKAAEKAIKSAVAGSNPTDVRVEVFK